MKKIALSGLLVLAFAAAAQAQVVPGSGWGASGSGATYTGRNAPGHGYGYGTRVGASSYYGGSGYCGGWGAIPGWWYGGGGYYHTAVAPGVAAGMWHPGGPSVAGYEPYGPGLGPSYAGYGPAPYAPVVVRPERVAERSPENVAAAAVDAGRRRVRAGDYKGAVDAIRTAVVAEGDVAAHEAWFAVALVLAGEPRPADKALRAALKHGFKGGLDLSLRDAKEAARAAGVLAQTGGEAAAYALARLGRPEALKALAEKDPALRPLLP